MKVKTSSSIFSASGASRTAGDMVGLACLLASLLLMSTGVRTVKADDDTLMSIDPALIEAEREKAAAQDTVRAVDARLPNAQAALDAAKPGAPGVEVQPGVVVLNTRGFNYGPPPAAIDPAALANEKAKPTR